MSARESSRINSTNKALETLFDISQLLNTELDRQTLALCVNMIELGANPEALATAVLDLRREAATARNLKAKRENRTEARA